MDWMKKEKLEVMYQHGNRGTCMLFFALKAENVTPSQSRPDARNTVSMG